MCCFVSFHNSYCCIVWLLIKLVKNCRRMRLYSVLEALCWSRGCWGEFLNNASCMAAAIIVFQRAFIQYSSKDILSYKNTVRTQIPPTLSAAYHTVQGWIQGMGFRGFEPPLHICSAWMMCVVRLLKLIWEDQFMGVVSSRAKAKARARLWLANPERCSSGPGQNPPIKYVISESSPDTIGRGQKIYI